MTWIALNCPQCGAPLPRLALWRSARCASCGTWVSRSESVVLRDAFHQSWLRARRDPARAGDEIVCGGERYELRHLLGFGEVSRVHVARRNGALPVLATVKLSTTPGVADRYAAEARVLRELQGLDAGVPGVYFSRLLPEVMAQGEVEDGMGRQALVLRHPSGYWGSLADLNERHPDGLDPRHGIWIWRRMLAVLGFVHGQGWVHGDVRPEHAIVHPADHGVRLIGWASARRGALVGERADDLVRSARVVQALLGGSGVARVDSGAVPAPFAELLERAGADEVFCGNQGAEGLDALLQSAARKAYGPPTFVSLST